MHCERLPARLGQLITWFVNLVIWLFIVLAMFTAMSARSSELPALGAREVLSRAMDYQLQFRAGDMDVVPQYVALLDAATKAQPHNADLWYAFGRANLMKGARALLPGGTPAEAMPAMQSGIAALQRALQIQPDHPDALAQLGAVMALWASVAKAPEKARQSVAQMNRAVELAPNSMRVRLVRAFLGSTLPDELRDHAAEAADLDFIIDNAYGSSSSEYVRIMRADLDYEDGRLGAARETYQLVADVGSPAAARDAKARLAALDDGGIALADIKALRSAAGAQCAMCHGQ